MVPLGARVGVADRWRGHGGRLLGGPGLLARRPLVRRALAGLTVLLAAVPVGLYAWIAAHRLAYPYELDWMEGGSVELAGRVLAGHSLYAAPSLAYVGWTYPPLYYWTAAALARVVGLGFLPLRLISFASSLVAIGALAAIVRRVGGGAVAGALAAGVFAATYALSGSWLDVGRLDSMFVALTLVAAWSGLRAGGARGGAGVGLLAFLAVFTKQPAAIALAPPLLWLLVRRPRVGLPAVGTLIGLLAASTVALDLATHGWYRYYVASELTGQSWVTNVWVSFWTQDLLAHLWPVAVLAGLALLTGMVRGPRSLGPARRDETVYLLATAGGLLAAAWLSRLHSGGYLNVRIPAYAAVALLAGLAAGALRRRGAVGGACVAGLLALQLALLTYPVNARLPTPADRRAGAALIAELRRLPRPVLVFTHPWYGSLAGSPSFAQSDGVREVLRSAAARGRRVLRRELAGALDALHVRTVVLDGVTEGAPLGPQLRREFRLTTIRLTPVRPLGDRPTFPAFVYIRR
jgi:hypothetical protein